MSFYYFGVEIEVIVEPHNKQRPVTTPINGDLKTWYGKIAAAMKNRNGGDQRPLKVVAEPQRSQYRDQMDRHQKWWITWEFSQRGHGILEGELDNANERPPVPFEAVSPRLETRKRWEDDIDAFWSAMRAVFHMPRRLSRCGSHVHVSPGRGEFTLKELQAIAFAVVHYDEQVQQVLRESRRDHPFCVRNKRSAALQDKTTAEIATAINGVQTKKDLVRLMQGLTRHDRAVLWNFQNVIRMPFNTTETLTNTVEFRGGRCLRGPVRTKRWIAFAVAFIILAIKEFKMPLKQSYQSPSQSKFWTMIRQAAATEHMEQFLPTSYKTMNESSRSPISDEDDPGEDYPYDAPNESYVPQSAGNSPMNTPDSSDAEDGYYRRPIRRAAA